MTEQQQLLGQVAGTRRAALHGAEPFAQLAQIALTARARVRSTGLRGQVRAITAVLQQRVQQLGGGQLPGARAQALDQRGEIVQRLRLPPRQPRRAGGILRGCQQR